MTETAITGAPHAQAPDGHASTTVPRWAPHPVPGTEEHTGTVLPARLTTALRTRADEFGVPVAAVLLAAHAKVLSALSADAEVTTGYLSPGAHRPTACRLTVGPGTWRHLTEEAHRALRLLPRTGRQRTDAPPEVVFDPSGDGRAPHGTALCVSTSEDDPRVLRLRYRTDVLDSGAAARIGGYHLRALERIAAAPEEHHERHTLLSAEEIRFQTEELGGPTRPVPDRRFHELFEERARERPDAVAAEYRGTRWTYRELNERANRLARALLSEGLEPEDVVAVVTERTLHWMAAVIAVLKAGGTYLPVDPGYPSGRIAAMLARSDCALVLTQSDASRNLDRALATRPGTRTLLLSAVAESTARGDDPAVAVAADRPAYVYFTSGSTGEPKGAVCEHAGMLNHLLAKIDDLGIEEGHVVAQTASQCFDISLWQLLAGPLAGGRTLIVEQEAVLDADRFLDTVADGRVTVLQVVPSYLDVLLSALERTPRPLPDLRRVSVTGEALHKGLVQRWFAALPGIPLVNAYGLTETSDDTNHEVMTGVPDGDRIPLGRPVANVRVYVVDDHLVPVPLGAPGAIVFSGICVGRGYVNDPERTRDAYLPDPYHPGQRLYRGGDFGRWLPGGKLEYHGRRDAQVKIRGFRVEIGEVENSLLRLPGVRDGAVVVTGEEDHARQLVAFCTGPRPAAEDALLRQLGELLPAYMVPASVHWRRALPLTANGKVDRAALGVLARDLGRSDDAHRPTRTPTERRLATAWAHVLGVPDDSIGRRDDFFALGGTSLSAVRLAVALDRTVSPRDLTAHPVLADLAVLIDERARPPRTGPEAVRAVAPPTPS
ncbi:MULTISPECIES: non-ribosomal peptide synthetase [unclassified Streptomyces]|uniref:non-ribosomal peptide synthetase n=1 Tax=unclassified Streptomyces TaxID=2593676 RepID=UPI0006AF2229|nr:MULTISPECIES: non-ribosomal peptide synthetase [unclassified Streptomyces]KOX36285.1 thioester reductase [Streptomyces sp. NRRL F-6491]KOX41194.1 thioester reductase [Streptomyces sp. NRRL F-6492]